jgi:peptidoglycan/LPS O-acetylase OafA/YrhL
MKYRAEIDGLRALAVLPVILFHAGFEWFSGGFVGVDVFFVISGYLITTIIISEMAEGKFSIVNFYERRARRILPALFFMMAACLPFAWLWLTPADLKDFGQSLVAVSTFSSNILFWLESEYFDTAAELKPLLHTWSLAVEEQYYILFPIFLMLTWKLGIRWILILLSIVFFISLGVAQWGAYNFPTAAFFLLPARGWELLVGVFAAFYLKYNTQLKSHILNQMLSLLGFGMIAYSIIAFDETTPFPSLYALIPTIGTGLLILCAVPKTFIHKLLSLKFIVGIGLVSYSAYLWHQPLLAFARHRLLGDVSDLILIALCITSLVMAWFSWKFIEAPFRDAKVYSRKSIFLMSFFSIILSLSIGGLLHITKGAEYRIPSYISLKDTAMHDSNGICFGRAHSYCNMSSMDKKIVVVGDSTAQALASSISNMAPNFSVVPMLSAGCVLVQGYDLYKGPIKQEDCSASVAEKKMQLIQSFDGAIVVYAGMFSKLLTGETVNNFQREQAWKKRYISTFGGGELRSSMIETIKKLLEISDQVFLVQSYELGIDAQKAAFLKYSFEDLSISKDALKDLHRPGIELSEEIQESKNLIIINPSDHLCSIDSQCSPLSSEGEPLFNDKTHPSFKLSDLIAREIIEQIN